MKQSKTDQILKDLSNKANAKGAVIVSDFGESITSNFKFIEDDIQHSTISSVIISIGNNLSNLAKYGLLNQIIIDCEKGSIFLKSVSEECLIVLYVKQVFNLKHVTKLLDEASIEIIANQKLKVA